jgi:hypothetical protein
MNQRIDDLLFRFAPGAADAVRAQHFNAEPPADTGR